MLIPLKVSAAGKSVFRSEVPNVGGGKTGNGAGDSNMLSQLISEHGSESDADAIREAAGLGSAGPLQVVGEVTAAFAGLASAGEERAELQSLLAMETTFVSVSAPWMKLGLLVVGG